MTQIVLLDRKGAIIHVGPMPEENKEARVVRLGRRYFTATVIQGDAWRQFTECDLLVLDLESNNQS